MNEFVKFYVCEDGGLDVDKKIVELRPIVCHHSELHVERYELWP